jgi:DNA-binding Lrp family transcriptional regulator
MEVLESDPAQSQRDLARKIGISLGHLNSLIKTLVREGYCTVCEKRKNRVAYLLTSKGIDEKSSLTYRYLWSGLNFFQDIQNKFQTIFAELQKQQKKRIVLFGRGQLSEIAGGALIRSNLQLVNIIDHIAELHGLDYDMILILELESHATVEEKLMRSGIARDKIMRL